MKTVLIMRHAKSSWKHTELTDFDRPLKKRGRRAAARMGRLLVAEELVPELIVSSPAARARETVEILTAEFAEPPTVVFDDDLYPGAPSRYVEALNRLDDSVSRVLVLGHNPGLEDWIGGWSRETLQFPTAAIAHFEAPVEAWSQFYVTMELPLLHLWKPKELPPEDAAAA